MAYEYFTYDSDYKVVAFAVDPEYLPGNKEQMFDLPIIPLSELEERYTPDDIELFVAISLPS